MKVKIFLAPTLSEMLALLCEQAVEGENNLIFAEDRLTLEVERAIIEKSGGSFTSSVTTFARFLRGEYKGKVLTKQGSVIVIGAIAAKCKEKLSCFKKNPAGCASRLYETIAQLRAALVTPEMLDDAILEADEILAEKLKDIALVYKEYLNFLNGGYLDESGVLELLPSAIKKSNKVKKSNVFFVGFSSFTKQAAEGINTALKNAKTVTGIFIGGSDEIYTNESALAFEKYCKASGAETEIIMVGGGACPAAEVLRKSLFNTESFSERAKPFKNVMLFEAKDEEDELSFIAAMIKKEVFGNNLRYRDITLFLPEISDYAVKSEKIFSEYKIPYFADVKKSILTHPVCRFILDYFKLIYDGFSQLDAISFVGNIFFEQDDGARFIFKNYLSQYANYRGGIKKQIKEEVFSEEDKIALNTVKTLSERAKNILSFAPPTADGYVYCNRVRAVLKEIDAEQIQNTTADLLKESGYASEAEFFSKGVESLLKVIDEAEILTRGVTLSAEEFSSLISESLKSLEISLIPQFTDAVFIGSLSESKKRSAKVVFGVGLTSDVPLASTDTALISDKDIDRLRSLKVEIQPKIREVNARVRENVALALSDFKERLYLSYPLSKGGNECKKSEIFDYVTASICKENNLPLNFITRGAIERWERENGAAYARYLSCVASERVPAVKELLLRAEKYRRGAADIKAHSGIYFALKKKGENVEELLEVKTLEKFIPSAAELMLKGRREISPTFIEGYFSCPYKNFTERGLKLKPIFEGAVKPVDTGDFMHAVLQGVAENFESFKNENDCARYSAEKAEKLLSKPPFCFLKDTNSGSFTSVSLLNEAVIVAKEVYRQIADSSFKVWGAEKTFGGKNADFKGITLLSGERNIILSGKIDRVDKGGDYVRVIDYKTGSVVDADTESYFTGRKLQLPLYISAVSAYAKPAGAYYFPARIAYAKSDGDCPFRMTGFSLGDANVLKMSDNLLENGKKSRYINATLGRNSDKQMSEEDFESFIDYSRLVAQTCASEVEKGCIAPSPYSGVCEYCKFGGVCGVDVKRYARSEEKNIKCTEIADVVRKRRGDK